MFQSSTLSYEQHQYNRLRCDAPYFELLLYTYVPVLLRSDFAVPVEQSYERASTKL